MPEKVQVKKKAGTEKREPAKKSRKRFENNSDKKFGAKNNVSASKAVKKQTGSEIFCGLQKKCGGCVYQGLAYQKQLDEKQKLVKKLLGDICEVKPIDGMDNPYHYRNKVHAVFKHLPDRIISGTYSEGSHRVVEIDSCLIEDENADRIICDIRGLLPSFGIKVFNEDTGYGLFRHVLVKVGKKTGQVMVVLVLSSPILPSKNNFVKALLELHPEITTIVVNVNDKKTSMVLGEKENVIYGKGYIEDELLGVKFRISPKSFYQVNPVQTEKLYTYALDAAEIGIEDTVVDAYCGIGTISLVAAQRAGKVIGVELNRDAIRDAVSNSKANGIKNVEFYVNDAGKFMTQMAEKGAKADVVIMDPPRSGCDEAFLSSVVTLGAARLVYVSCNPETLARDLKYLGKHGYKAKYAQPVDMFPWTGHVETCVLLSRETYRRPDARVKIDIDLDDYYRIKEGDKEW